MVWLPEGEESSAVSTQYQQVTDRQTDRLTDGYTNILPQHGLHYAYASHGKKQHTTPKRTSLME